MLNFFFEEKYSMFINNNDGMDKKCGWLETRKVLFNLFNSKVIDSLKEALERCK